MSGLLDKERIIAGPGFNRWLVPPAALAIHLCIGMAYGFSVFWLSSVPPYLEHVLFGIMCGPKLFEAEQNGHTFVLMYGLTG